MSLARPHHSEGGPFRGESRFSIGSHHSTIINNSASATTKKYNTSDNHFYYNNDNHIRNYINSHDLSRKASEHSDYYDYVKPEVLPSSKRRKFSSSTWENSGRPHNQYKTYETAPSSCSENSFLPPATTSDVNAYTSTSCKRERPKFEDEEVVFMSRDEIERCSPSRKDGIDATHETHLRYSYCAFLQNLGVSLELPQTTIGSAMVLCHRFFVRRSHACHDRFLIATAALFLATKSEETPCPLNNVLRTSCEIFHKQDFNLLYYLLPANWFEQYRERVIEAEQLILTTLNFELNVQHPYAPLTSILEKLGLTQSFLVHLALSLVSEGAGTGMLMLMCSLDEYKMFAIVLVLLSAILQKILGKYFTCCCYVCWLRSSLWLQFKPHQIAAGAAYLAAKSLNMDLSSCQHIWQEFHTPPSVLKDVVQQLMELF